ncbi:MAG: secretion protein [Isosphaeraceae bacterium]
MSRPNLRRSFSLESLESREVLSAGGPSAEAQYMLELINQARTNPQAMADRVTTDLDPDVMATVKYYGTNLNAVHDAINNVPARPPVAWSDQLAAAATGQSLDQNNTGIQTHQGADGSWLGQRLDRIGVSNRVAEGENAYAYSQSVDHAMEAFLIDWGVADAGHRRNILQPDANPDQYYKEVGIGIVDSTRPGFGPKVITQDFATRAGQKAFVVGVTYSDSNGNGRYDMNEGRGDVDVTAVNIGNGQITSVQSWDAGGYQIPLDPGGYDVTARVNGNVVRSDRVWIGNQNVKVDYNLINPGPSTVPAPVTPTPVVAAPVAQPTVVNPVTPVNAWNALSNSGQSSQYTAQVQAQTLIAPTRSAAARTGGGWLTNWSAWTARRSR